MPLKARVVGMPAIMGHRVLWYTTEAERTRSIFSLPKFTKNRHIWISNLQKNYRGDAGRPPYWGGLWHLSQTPTPNVETDSFASDSENGQTWLFHLRLCVIKLERIWCNHKLWWATEAECSPADQTETEYPAPCRRLSFAADQCCSGFFERQL